MEEATATLPGVTREISAQVEKKLLHFHLPAC